MTQLSGQTIEERCSVYRVIHVPPRDVTWWDNVTRNSFLNPRRQDIITQVPMISPFVATKQISNGKSYGLSSASYDCRIKHDCYLDPIAGEKCCALVTTIERFAIPDDICGYVCDKSSYARVFVSAFNTLFDPGFSGKTQDNENPEDPWSDAVIELVNLGNYPVEIKAGDPICQFAFHFLDKPARNPYRGKYSGQRGAQPAIFETDLMRKVVQEGPQYRDYKRPGESESDALNRLLLEAEKKS